jgi:hypothetical protein
VSWSTTWEIDIRRYELERRPESGGAYTVVTGKQTAGNGTTLTPHAYAVTDSLVPAGGWWYRTVGVSSDGARFPAEPVFVRVAGTIVSGTSDAPMPGADNYPNPFNPATEIRFSVPTPVANDGVDAGGAAGWVTLKVYDLLGREVAVLVDERKDPGTYTVTFNAHASGGRSGGLASGVYLYRLTAGGSTITRRMLLTK